MHNRLDLNFALQTLEQRKAFVDSYLTRPMFTEKPPTQKELEQIANYILWGKDKNGKNITQTGEVEIDTKKQTWSKKKEESLDALLESPTFNEAEFNSIIPKKAVKPYFDRDMELKQAPDYIKKPLEDLYKSIDRVELENSLYEELHEMRTCEIRKELLNKFSEAEIEKEKKLVKNWTEYHYLKSRHLLVDLRKEKFTYRDCYKNIHSIKNSPLIMDRGSLTWDSDIIVFPLGLKNDLFFRDLGKLNPANYTQEDLWRISNIIWEKEEQLNEVKRNQNLLFLDFENLDHIANIFTYLYELEFAAEVESYDSTTSVLVETLDYYVKLADLSDIHKDILQMKKDGVRNTDIAYEINHKYNKSYAHNYISTIFRHQIITRICEAVSTHKEIINNLFYEENFKTCRTCGRTLLKNGSFYMKNKKTRDGFSTQCKKCKKGE